MLGLLDAAEAYRDAYEAVRDVDSEIDVLAAALKDGQDGANEALVAARRERNQRMRVRSKARHALWQAILAARTAEVDAAGEANAKAVAGAASRVRFLGTR